MTKKKETAEEIAAPRQWLCIETCYFNMALSQKGDIVPYAKGIENCPYFEEV